MGAVSDILKHIGPRFFAGLARESEHTPATIAGMLFCWLALLVATAIGGWFFTAHVTATDTLHDDIASSVIALKPQIEKNTVALDCSRADRLINAKVREVANTKRLVDLAVDEPERREHATSLALLQRELSEQETAYRNKCL